MKKQKQPRQMLRFRTVLFSTTFKRWVSKVIGADSGNADPSLILQTIHADMGNHSIVNNPPFTFEFRQSEKVIQVPVYEELYMFVTPARGGDAILVIGGRFFGKKHQFFNNPPSLTTVDIQDHADAIAHEREMVNRYLLKRAEDTSVFEDNELLMDIAKDLKELRHIQPAEVEG